MVVGKNFAKVLQKLHPLCTSFNYICIISNSLKRSLQESSCGYDSYKTKAQQC